MQNLSGRVAVITGGASGIGRGMAEAFAAQGMKLVLADIEDAALAPAVAALRGGGAEVIGVRCDVTSPQSVADLAERTLAQYGAVHVVCNNAGVAGASNVGALWELPLADWEWVLGVNTWGVIHGVRAFMPILAQQPEAHVVNTASLAGTMVSGGIYGVSKHACVAISEALYRECQLRAPRVGVSVLCPGWVNTRILESERNRPEAPRPAPTAPPSSEFGAAREVIAGLIKSGLPPRRVGEIVVEGIRANRFYVFTHPHWNYMMKARFDAILNDQPPPVVAPPPGESWSD
ncbi:MAG TPA: SDR family NAD(P)-dependent oxidoreductase [Myxococcota bacterium]|jgi:NAD(P)-dependent dehydrogenase (short-subunit alcohol dehydrogenase family)